MWRSSVLVLILLVVQACRPQTETEVLAIRSVLEEQVEAWNEGDIEGYMQGYHRSEGLIFTGGKNKTMGWDDALERYLKSYPSKAAMGELKFEDLHIELVTPGAAFSTGEWWLYRTNDTLQGRFTLVWRKVDGNWVIIADHSS